MWSREGEWERRSGQGLLSVRKALRKKKATDVSSVTIEVVSFKTHSSRNEGEGS